MRGTPHVYEWYGIPVVAEVGAYVCALGICTRRDN